MKARIIIISLLLTVLLLVSCNSNESAPTNIEDQNATLREISETEALFNLEKLLAGQSLLLKAKSNDIETYKNASEELHLNWTNFHLKQSSSNEKNNNILDRVEILEKYFPSLSKFTKDKSLNNRIASYYVLMECQMCGWIYDQALGDPDNGVRPGTPFEKLPGDWVCPDCGSAVDDFAEYEP